MLDFTVLRFYGTTDYAVTDEVGATDPDYTVHCVWGVDRHHNIYLIDMWRGRTTPDVWAKEWIKLVKRWKPLRWFEEAGQIRSAVSPFLDQMIAEEHAWTDRVAMASTVDKAQRAQPLLAWAAMGKFYLPDKTKIQGHLFECVEAMVRELMEFDTGRHDDCVDAASMMGRAIHGSSRERRRSQKCRTGILSRIYMPSTRKSSPEGGNLWIATLSRQMRQATTLSRMTKGLSAMPA